MGTKTDVAPRDLTDLTRLIQTCEGFPSIVAALRSGLAATIDGAWGSSCALACAALEQHAPACVVLVSPHVSDVDDLAADVTTFSGTPCPVFPAWESLPKEQLLADEIFGQRLRFLNLLEGPSAPRLIATSIQALLQPVPSREQRRANTRVVTRGERLDVDELLGWLTERGFTAMSAVELPGEFSRRGGIVDVFSPDGDLPVRIELFGDDVESIRRFNPTDQRSLDQLESVAILAARPGGDATGGSPDATLSPPTLTLPRQGGEGSDRASPNATPHPSTLTFHQGGEGNGTSGVHFCHYVPPNTWFVLIEPEDLREQARHYLERLEDPRGFWSVDGTFRQLTKYPTVTISSIAGASFEATCQLRSESVERFSGDVRRVHEELEQVVGNDDVLITCHNEAEQHRLREVLGAGSRELVDRLHLCVGRIRAGFRLVDAHVLVLSDHELFRRQELRRPTARRTQSRVLDNFLDLNEGDLVVHVSHGIARYHGMKLLEKNDQVEEYLVLEFREKTKLYVPASKIHLVQKYVGGGKASPTLSKLGGASWLKRKRQTEQAVHDLASEMIDLQAARETQPGIRFPDDSDWQTEFEATFPYTETPDQLATLAEMKANMQQPRPMDRLICGDVGYGKTELAMRAAFKVVDYGKQVAVLVPTTVLAEQHYRTFSERMAEYPFCIEVLSRFKTRAEQRRILDAVAEGKVDIVIGTHRLFQPDVRFHDLGLVVIDEEQRFGVEHKNRLRAMRTIVDVLTLTATPIPRTLHLALLGARDISNLDTPPLDRLAIETRVSRFDPTLVRHAIVRELNRDGQVYFVHNRVHNIKQIAGELQALVPEARIAIVHGQMPEASLERAMTEFVAHQSDILVATTIIESGLDIPNVNTILINQADRYGLADLHQLRGRVGRSKRRAYCYLLIDDRRPVTSNAVKRLKAIEEYSQLGAGFKIALRDLEIRGAGNILGTQQSGHITAVGYELYCQLLENAVRRLRNQPVKTVFEVSIDLPGRAFLPRDYVATPRDRIDLYRRLSRVDQLKDLRDLSAEIRDRFGPEPASVDYLLAMAEMRILARRWQIDDIHLEDDYAVLSYRDRRPIEQLVKKSGNHLRVADGRTAYLPISKEVTDPGSVTRVLKVLLQSS